MTDNLIGPKPDGPKYPTPWQAIENDVCDAKGYLVLQVNAESADLEEEDTQLAKAIVDAVNVHCGRLGGAADVLDAKDARIAELEKRVKDVDRDRWDLLNRAEDAEVYRDVNLKRAEKAEADLEWATEANQKFEVRIWEEQKRAEEAERLADKRLLQRQAAKKRAQSAEARKVEAEERAEKAEARVRELERDYYLKARSVGFGWQAKADMDTFTAPDGRVFRVGQRVQGAVSGLFATVKGFASHGLVELTYDGGGAGTTKATALRRVWDGSEEPDVPVGTVLRDAEGFFLKKNGFGFFGWQLWHKGTAKWSLPLYWDDWDHSEEVRPYVEWLPGDDE